MTSLYELEKDVREKIRNMATENPDMTEPNYDGSLHEIVDSSVPVYNYDILQIGAHNLELATNVPECGPAFDGTPTPINIIAANIYEHLSGIAWEEWYEIEQEREKAA